MLHTQFLENFQKNIDDLNTVLSQENDAIDNHKMEEVSEIVKHKQNLFIENDKLIKQLQDFDITQFDKNKLISDINNLQEKIIQNITTIDKAINLYNRILGAKFNSDLYTSNNMYDNKRKNFVPKNSQAITTTIKL
jgi:hypothetical protein